MVKMYPPLIVQAWVEDILRRKRAIKVLKNTTSWMRDVEKIEKNGPYKCLDEAEIWTPFSKIAIFCKRDHLLDSQRHPHR